MPNLADPQTKIWTEEQFIAFNLTVLETLKRADKKIGARTAKSAPVEPSVETATDEKQRIEDNTPKIQLDISPEDELAAIKGLLGLHPEITSNNAQAVATLKKRQAELEKQLGLNEGIAQNQTPRAEMNRRFHFTLDIIFRLLEGRLARIKYSKKDDVLDLLKLFPQGPKASAATPGEVLEHISKYPLITSINHAITSDEVFKIAFEFQLKEVKAWDGSEPEKSPVLLVERKLFPPDSN